MLKTAMMYPMLMPLGMVGYNVMRVACALAFEGSFKSTSFQYIFLYAGTLPAARRGDLTPFLTILAGI